MQKRFLNFFIIIGFFINITSYINSFQDLSNPYSDVTNLLPFNDHGWYANGEWIKQLMENNKVTTVIEVGSWLGLSTRHIASLLQPNGKLYAVDTWKGSVEHHENANFSSFLPTLYEQFLSNMIHAHLTNIVIPMKMTSLEAAPILMRELDNVNLIYIDAAHDTYSVVLDLHAYWQFVNDKGGILCGDDWLWDSVRLAVKIFAQSNKLTIYASDNFWFVKNEGVYAEKDFKNENIDIWKFDTLQ
jgi:predicted O-methyltransferase YrrM